MTEQEFKEIKNRSENASVAPWTSYIEGRNNESGSNFIMVGEGENRQEDIYLTDATDADQDFIAHARQDIPKLLHYIGQLTRMLDVKLTPKELAIAKEAMQYRIKSMQDLLDNPDTQDEKLAYIADGNDIPILESVIDEIIRAEKKIEKAKESLYENRYVLLKDEEGLTLQPYERERDSTQKVFHDFYAKDFSEAGSVRNQFMGWSQYIPMPEHISVRRTLTLFDENKEPIADVDFFAYQPQEIEENNCRCDFHLTIQHENSTRQGWITKNEYLGGKNSVGVDSTQALLLAMRLAEMLIEGYNNDHKEKIYWLEYGQKAVLLDLGTIPLNDNNL